MGSTYQFRCSSCGYEVMVSGGDDYGFSVSTTTIFCEGCEELHDVITATFPPYPSEDEFEQDEPACPKDRRHSVRRWRDPGPCPKCGNQMIMGDLRALWD